MSTATAAVAALSATSAVLEQIGRRVALAERQVARRAVARGRSSQIKFNRTRRERRHGIVGDSGMMMRNAIIARHEAWEMGPLAPRSDSWAAFDPDRPLWGSVSPMHATPDAILKKEQLEARCAWAGGPKTLCLRAKDRVVVIEGPWKGRIGKVKEVMVESGSLSIEDLRVNVSLPDYMTPGRSRVIEPMSARIPISAVRLVYPLRDEATGVTRDVIVRELRAGPVLYDRPTRRRLFSRSIPGVNVRIPWPAGTPTEREANPCDTIRLDVEERTFVPTLLRPPVPELLIDELRNRYSKFRTRHSDEYIAEKAAELEKTQAQKEMARTMLTPLQEFNRQRRDARRALGQPELSEDMLEKIGQIMAKNKHVALDAAGLTEVVEPAAAPETTPSPSS